MKKLLTANQSSIKPQEFKNHREKLIGKKFLEENNTTFQPNFSKMMWQDL